MRRPRLAAFAASAVLALTLPACDIDLGPGAGSLPVPPDPCAGWAPSASACDLDRCLTVGNCTHESCDPETGLKSFQVCETPPALIDGDWALTARLDIDDPCPEVMRVDEVAFKVVDNFSGTANILDQDGSLIDTAETSGGYGVTGLRFTLHPLWSGPGGAVVEAIVDYDVYMDTRGQVGGTASASATSGDTTCTYSFRVEGTRS
jgi:hypothetical protein